MYASDYGYAISGGTTNARNTCLNKEIYNWDSVNDCYTNDWLFNSSNQWTLTSCASYFSSVFYFRETGFINDVDTLNPLDGVRPVVFLKSNIKIVDGDGSSSNPYILQS